MMVIVRWVLRLAPVGVFALVFPLGAEAGIGAIGALGHYLLLVCALCVVLTLAMYPVTALLGVPVRRFAAAAAPAQAVAFDGAQKRLGIPAGVSGLVLPLAVSLMRISTPVKTAFGAVFAAQLLGIALTPAAVAAGAAVAVAMSLGSVGLPGGVMFMAVRLPVFTAMGVPIEVFGPMLAVEPIVDPFGTVANVTADVGATAIVAHGVSTPEDTAVALSEMGDSLSGKPASVRAAGFPR